MAIANCLRHFRINNLVTVLAIALLDDVSNHKRGIGMISSSYLILQFFELSAAVRALLEFEDDSGVCSIRSLA